MVITGDFNHLELCDIQESFNLRQLVDFNTRADAKLDLIFTNSVGYQQCEKLAPLDRNDHCSIFLPSETVSKDQYVYTTKRPISPSIRNMVMMEIISLDWSSVLQADTVDSKVQALHDTVNTVLDTFAPVKTVKKKVTNPESDLIRKIRRAKDRAHRSGSQSWKTLSILLNKLIRKRKIEQYKTMLNSAFDDNRMWWQNLKKLDGKNTEKGPQPKNYVDGKWMGAEEFVQYLNNYYCTVNQCAAEGMSTLSTNSPLETTLTNMDEVSMGEVKLFLKQINTRKATHSEDFPSWLTKEAAEDLVVPVTDIINCMMRTKTFPSLWKKGEVTPLKKCNNPITAKDYRPITLLWHLGKIAEKVIAKRYKQCLIPRLETNQFAYLQGRSTTDALLAVLDDWTKSLDNINTSYVSAAMIDFSKAFDRVRHDLLVKKLYSLEVHPGLVQLIYNFLQSRQQCVRYAGICSDYRTLTIGTPQGTILGPLLWLAYINDLSPRQVTTVKFADDTTIYCSVSKNSVPANHHLTTSLEECDQWCKDNHMLLNASKTQILNISTVKCTTAPVTLNGEMISSCNSAKLLGVIIDERLSFQDHVDSVVSKCNQRIFALRKLKSYGTDRSSLLRYYSAMIMSVLVYACPAWFPLTDKQCRHDLESVQRRVVEIIAPECSGYTERLDTLSLNTLESVLKERTTQYYDMITLNPNHVLYDRVEHTHHLRRSGRNKNSHLLMPKCRLVK